MKQLTTLLVSLLLAVPITATASKPLKIHISKPGTLKSLIGEARLTTTQSLTLSGTINSTDLLYIRHMAGAGFNSEETPGQLRHLDMKDVAFSTTGLPYVNREGFQRTTSAHTLPKFALRNTKLESIVLPERLDTIGVGALEMTNIQSIELPKGVVVDQWGLAKNEKLTTITSKTYLNRFRANALNECNALKTVELNNVNSINGYVFHNLPSLETFTINGWVGFIEGWGAFKNCPKLRNIDIAGVVLTLGGVSPAVNCPELTSFHLRSVVVVSNVYQADGCPKLKSITFDDYVYNADSANFNKGKFVNDTIPQRMLKAARTVADAVYDMRTHGITRPKFPRETALLFAEAAIEYINNGDVAQSTAYWGMIQDWYNLADGVLDAITKGHVKNTIAYDKLKGMSEMKIIQALGQPEEGEDSISKNLATLRATPAYAQPVTFSYTPPTDTALVRIREYFNLDSIAGNGDEISRIKNVMYWLHDQVRHDGSSKWPDCKFNAIDLINVCKTENRGLNCRFLAMTLNQLYLSLGFKSRYLTCQSAKYKTDPDCHVINCVWSETLGKWVWMDPSFAAYVTDENGLLLHPGEVRERLISGAPLVLNEDANWNHESIQTKEHYLEDYMAKNLYVISAPQHSTVYHKNNEATGRPIVAIVPTGFDFRESEIILNDPSAFWQEP